MMQRWFLTHRPFDRGRAECNGWTARSGPAVLDHSAKSIEIEDIQARVTALEGQCLQSALMPVSVCDPEGEDEVDALCC